LVIVTVSCRASLACSFSDGSEVLTSIQSFSEGRTALRSHVGVLRSGISATEYHVRAQDRPADGRQTRGPEHHESEVVVLEVRILSAEFQALLFERDRAVEQVESHAIGAIPSSLLRVEVVVCAPVVLVDVVVLDQNSLDRGGQAVGELLRHGLWRVLGIDQLLEFVQVAGTSNGHPFVHWKGFSEGRRTKT
jgi:hypothetical protein